MRDNVNDFSITDKSNKFVFKITTTTTTNSFNVFFTFLLEFVKEKIIPDTF